MTEKEKMLAGKIYDPSEKELAELRTKAHKLSQQYSCLYEDETKVITLSPVCPTMNEKSIKELTKTANELADQIFEYADENPEAVKPYLDGYPILVVEGKKYKDTLV